MVFGPPDANFLALQDHFKFLSETPGTSAELHGQSFVESYGNIHVTLINAGGLFPQGKRGRLGLRRLQSVPSAEFEWRRTSEGWDYLARLIAPLVASESPGHQYLTNYPGEDAIVVVSKGEYGDDVLGDAREA
jgi:hypothetical protein